MGRFTQIDPIMGNRPSQHYAYAGNNPVSMVDPMGEDGTLSDAWEGVKASVAKAANFAKGIYHVGPMTGPHRLIEAVVADRGGFIDSTEYVLWGGGAKALVADAEKRGQVLMDHGKMSPYPAGIVGPTRALTAC